MTTQTNTVVYLPKHNPRPRQRPSAFEKTKQTKVRSSHVDGQFRLVKW